MFHSNYDTIYECHHRHSVAYSRRIGDVSHDDMRDEEVPLYTVNSGEQRVNRFTLVDSGFIPSHAPLMSSFDPDPDPNSLRNTSGLVSSRVA